MQTFLRHRMTIYLMFLNFNSIVRIPSVNLNQVAKNHFCIWGTNDTFRFKSLFKWVATRQSCLNTFTKPFNWLWLLLLHWEVQDLLDLELLQSFWFFNSFLDEGIFVFLNLRVIDNFVKHLLFNWNGRFLIDLLHKILHCALRFPLHWHFKRFLHVSISLHFELFPRFLNNLFVEFCLELSVYCWFIFEVVWYFMFM